MVVVFRIENQKRKERETQEPDENSKSTLECLSSWCQVLKEWRRCSSYGNPWKELPIKSIYGVLSGARAHFGPKNIKMGSDA